MRRKRIAIIITGFLFCLMGWSACVLCKKEQQEVKPPTAAVELSPTGSQAESPTESPTESPKPTATQVPTPTESPAVSPTESPTESPTPTVTQAPTPAVSPTESPTPTVTQAPTPAVSPTESPTPTVTQAPTPAVSPTVSPTESPKPTATQAPTPAVSPTESPAVSPTESPKPTVTQAPTPTESPTVSPIASPTESPKPTVTMTPMPTKPPEEREVEEMLLTGWQVTMDINEDHIILFPDCFDRVHLEYDKSCLRFQYESSRNAEIAFSIVYNIGQSYEAAADFIYGKEGAVREREGKSLSYLLETSERVYRGYVIEETYELQRFMAGEQAQEVPGTMQLEFSFPIEKRELYEAEAYQFYLRGRAW